MKKFEDLLDDLGGFNRFQFLIVFGVFSMKFVAGFSMLQMAFMGFLPDFYCNVTGNSSSEGGGQNTTHAIPTHTSDNDNETQNVCSVSGKSCQSYEFVGDARTIMTEWHLVCDLNWVKATTTSIQMVGVFLGAFVSGHLGDLIGRKKTIYGFYFLHAIFNLVAAFSNSWPMYMVLRFFIGTGIGAILVLILPYPVEFLPLRWRATLPLIPMFPIGSGVFGLCAWFVEDWSTLHIMTAVLSVPNLLGYPFIPESFRWLAVKGHVKEAYKVIEMIGKVNRKPVPSYALDIVKDVAKDENSKGENQRMYSYLDLFKGKTRFRCTVVFAVMWCFISMVFYGASFGVSSFGGNIYLNMILINVLDVPLLFLVFFVNKCVGRRMAQSGLLLVSCLAFLGRLIIFWTDSSEIAGIYISLIAKVFVAGAWAVSQAWVTEVYPTVMRNLGYGMANMASRIGGIVAPFAINFDEFAVPSYILMCVVIFISLVLTLFVPDTKHMALTDSGETSTEEEVMDASHTNADFHGDGEACGDSDEFENGQSGASLNETAFLLNTNLR